MRTVDGKYFLEGNKIIKGTNGQEIPEDEPLFLLRARDHLAAPLLWKYRELAIEDGCTQYHIDGIEACIAKFEEFARTFPERMKQPGCTLGK
jgi:hypothetical protein